MIPDHKAVPQVLKRKIAGKKDSPSTSPAQPSTLPLHPRIRTGAVTVKTRSAPLGPAANTTTDTTQPALSPASTAPASESDTFAEPRSARTERRLAPGEFLFREQDEADCGYVVVSGTIEICKLSEGRYIVLSELDEGALFGEMAIIDRSPRSAAARAKTDVIVREIDEETLSSYVTQSPQMAVTMMKRLATYVRTSNQALEGNPFASSPQNNEGTAPAGAEHHQSYWTKLRAESVDNTHIIDEFQSPSDAIIRKRLPPALQYSFWATGMLVIACVLWASLSITDVFMSAKGRLTTTVPKVIVQAGETASVRSISVSAGQIVKSGTVLATLDPTTANADFAAKKQEYDQTLALIQRLDIERESGDLSDSGRVEDPLQQDIFANRWQEYHSKLLSFDLAVEKASFALDAARQKQQMSQVAVQEAARTHSRNAQLYPQHIVSEAKFTESRFALSRSQIDLKGADIALKMAQRDLDTTQSDRQAFISGWQKQIGEDLSAARQRRDALREDLVKIERRQDNIRIIAPTDAVVLEVPDLSVGSIVSAGQAMMTLIPVDVPLTVEMDIDPNDIGNLALGNEVSVKLTALPYQKHGDLKATITFISADTVTESITGEKGTFYRARAEINANNLRGVPADFHLISGMQLTSDIIVGKRRLITYILYPVIRTIDTSFREP